MSWSLFYAWLLASVPLVAAHVWAEQQCTRLDVESGRRDGMSLIDDYGSNRGWYWQYKIVSITSLLIGGPGVVVAMLILVIFVLEH